jgi:ADP-ribose pyrophosphatase
VPTPWELLGTAPGWEHFRRIEVRRYRLPSGAEGDYDIIVGGATVAVLAQTGAGRFVLARQWRLGPGRTLSELPGGAVDAGEEPAAAAARELREETGYVGDLRFVGAYPVGAYTSRVAHAFVATGCRRVGAPQLDELEDIEVAEVGLDELRAVLRAGDLTDGHAAYLGLDALGLL